MSASARRACRVALRAIERARGFRLSADELRKQAHDAAPGIPLGAAMVHGALVLDEQAEAQLDHAARVLAAQVGTSARRTVGRKRRAPSPRGAQT